MSQGGHIVKPHGRLKSWRIMYRDPDGHQQSEGKFRTKRDAQRRLNEVLASLDKGTYSRISASTFDSFAQGWLEARRRLRGSTESAYGSLVAKQLIPRLGQIRISDLRFKHCDALVSGMIEDELSPKTIRNAVILLRSMLIGKTGPSAQSQGILPAGDPTRGLELPPLEHQVLVLLDAEAVWRLIGAAKELSAGVSDVDVRKASTQNRERLSHPEEEAFGDITGRQPQAGSNPARQHQFYQICYLGAFTGLRRNELLGLRFCDVLWFDNEIHVQHAISKAKATDGAHKWQWVLGPPKSRKSVRRIAGTESVMKLLAELKVGRAEEEFVFSQVRGIESCVSGSEASTASHSLSGDSPKFIDPDVFDEDIWRPIAVKAGLPAVRFHDLRHFFASQLIAQGETPAYVRDQMGHSSIQVTFDVYGHLFRGAGQAASQKFEKAMKAARKPKEAPKAEREVQQ